MHPIFIDYLSAVEVDCADATVRNYKQAFNRFQEFLDESEIDLAQITQQEVQNYIVMRAERFAVPTLKTHIKAVRAAYNYAKNVSCTLDRKDDPFWRLRYPQVIAKAPETYSDAEIQKLFDAIVTDREWLCFHLLAYAGLRREEVCDLRWEDVDLKARHLEIVGKGNKWRRVPIHPKLAAALAPHRKDSGHVIVTESRSTWYDKPAGTRVDPDTLHRSLAFWFARSGVAGAHMHRFRRTVASVLLEKGVPKEYRDEILGWKPTDVEGRNYTRLAPPQLHESICKLNYTARRTKNEDTRTARTRTGASSDIARKLWLIRGGDPTSLAG